MSMPKFKGIHGPFPIIFGLITNSSIRSVIVTIGGNDAGRYKAKLIEYGGGQRLWYIVLPSSATDPYGIAAYNGEGIKVASRSFDDSRDVASVLINMQYGDSTLTDLSRPPECVYGVQRHEGVQGQEHTIVQIRAMIASSTSVPLNVMALPDLTDCDKLKELGVRRLSLGGSLYRKMTTLLEQCAVEMLDYHDAAILFR